MSPYGNFRARMDTCPRCSATYFRIAMNRVVCNKCRDERLQIVRTNADFKERTRKLKEAGLNYY